MSIDLTKASEIAGFVGACLVDGDTGLMLTSHGGGGLDLEAVAAQSTEVFKAQNSAVAALRLSDPMEEMLVTLGRRVHILRPLSNLPGTFLWVALDRTRANLGMARLQVKALEESLSL
jgi:predicted regulator of Ras-like GTPase activity (Roadblock/LC7/MglB family)